jgi:hypothetical protein
MAKRDKGEGPEAAQKRKGAARPLREHWKEEPDEHDYPAALDYLSLLLGQADAARLVKSLQQATITHRKAKDLLRASRLGLLGPEDAEVMKDLRKVRRDERLSPVLLVRGSLASDVAMTVADGYHRICASYHLDEDADIPCRIVDPPREPRASGTRTSLQAGSRRSRSTTPAVRASEEGG